MLPAGAGSEDMGMIAVIRIRGDVNLRADIKDTLRMMRLHRVNHLVLVKDDGTGKGMVKKVKDYVTYGEIGEATLARVIGKRGRAPGNRRLDEGFYKIHKVSGAAEVAKMVAGGKKKLEDFGIKPVFRLGPPKKGHGRLGIKRTYSVGGALGYRAADINRLIEKMC